MPASSPLLNTPSRQVTAAATVIAAAMLITTAVSLWEDYWRTLAKVESDTRNVARLLAEHAGQSLDAVDSTLRAVDRLRRDVERGIYRSQASIHVNLRTLQGGSPVLTELAWFDAYGDRVATSISFDPPRLSIATRDQFREPADHPDSSALHIDVPLPSDDTGDNWSISVSRRMEHSDRTLAGVASGTVDAQAFVRLFQTLELGPGYAITLLRSDGVVLARTPSGDPPPGGLWPDRHLLDVVAPQNPGATYSSAGSKDIASFARVPRVGGLLLIDVRVNRNAAFAGYRRDMGIIAIELVLGLVVLFVGTRLIVNGLRRREELQAALAQAVGEARDARTEAEAANRAKSDFLARMSHELRTPLNAVLGFGQMIGLDPTRTLSAKQKEYCGYIVTSGQHLLDLINEVLDFAGIESGRMSVARERVATEAALEGAAAMMQPAAIRAGVTIDLQDVSRLPDLNSDPLRLRQVLVNLIGNAIKYNRPNGKVVLSAVPLPGDRVRIAVADTGHGIPAALQGNLFEPFERLGAEHSGIEGTGLGLTLSKRLVEAMGGAIGFDSTVGSGSTFWIDLPACKAVPEPAARRGDAA